MNCAGNNSIKDGVVNFFKKHSTNADTHTYISTYPYKYMHTHSTPMSTPEIVSQLDLEIHKVGHQERLTVNGDVVFH
jgi:hypothetical protein